MNILQFINESNALFKGARMMAKSQPKTSTGLCVTNADVVYFGNELVVKYNLFAEDGFGIDFSVPINMPDGTKKCFMVLTPMSQKVNPLLGRTTMLTKKTNGIGSASVKVTAEELVSEGKVFKTNSPVLRKYLSTLYPEIAKENVLQFEIEFTPLVSEDGVEIVAPEIFTVKSVDKHIARNEVRIFDISVKVSRVLANSSELTEVPVTEVDLFEEDVVMAKVNEVVEGINQEYAEEFQEPEDYVPADAREDSEEEVSEETIASEEDDAFDF